MRNHRPLLRPFSCVRQSLMRHSLLVSLRLPRLDSVLGSFRTRRPLYPRPEAIKIWRVAVYVQVHLLGERGVGWQ
jgi:hypothetical protein